ncbi:MAG: cytochrome ubiquinol oxidase subunit I, partial [Saezia sp.]
AFFDVKSPEEAARTKSAGTVVGSIHIPYVMGLIGTRSLTTEIPGINELAFGQRIDGQPAKVRSSVERIKSGLIAYNALREIRLGMEKGSYTRFTDAPMHLQAAVKDNIQDYGYALMLRGKTAAVNGSTQSPDLSRVTEQDIYLAAANTIPMVGLNFWSFRLMVGIGFYLFAFMLAFFFLAARRNLEKRKWLLKVAVWTIPLPWIAAELGWCLAEFGRQPWIIEGVLPTNAAHSELGVVTLLATIIGFALLYTVLIVIEMGLMFRQVKKGPEADPDVSESLT